DLPQPIPNRLWRNAQSRVGGCKHDSNGLAHDCRYFSASHAADHASRELVLPGLETDLVSFYHRASFGLVHAIDHKKFEKVRPHWANAFGDNDLDDQRSFGRSSHHSILQFGRLY